MSLYDIPVTAIDGTAGTLEPYRGKVILVVNVASRCGFTGQYAALEALYQKYQGRGLVVLGFPCNQFMGQEPGTESDIRQFCSLRFNVSFPMFAKVRVNGSGAHPLYRHLKAERRGLFWTKAVKWNFTKFLVNRDGKVVGRYGPASPMSRVERSVVALLG